jgi:hypothetical protein
MPAKTKVLKMVHVVMYSGGACSWAAAMRVKERHPGEQIVLLFADTRIEDEDLYRFLDDSQKQLGLELIRIADGRTPWEIMRHKHVIANSRIDPCSEILKRKLLDRWYRKNCQTETATLHFGIDWTELHRLKRLREAKQPWRCEAYMTEAPYLQKREMLAWMRKEGLRAPRLYDLGFHHNNCGGFCVKAGQAHFANLLNKLPERYAFHEEQERQLRRIVGDHSILPGRTLEQFRLSIEAKEPIDEFDFGGCGCAIDP